MAMREKKRPKKGKVVELEAELYGTIATLDSISEKFDEGDLQPALYKRQFKSLVSDTIKTRQLLEAEGETWDEFIEEEKITERFGIKVKNYQKGDLHAFCISWLLPMSSCHCLCICWGLDRRNHEAGMPDCPCLGSLPGVCNCVSKGTVCKRIEPNAGFRSYGNV